MSRSRVDSLLPGALLGCTAAVASTDPHLLGDAAGVHSAVTAAVAAAAAGAALRAFGRPPLHAVAVTLAGLMGWAVVAAVFSEQPGTSLLAVTAFAGAGVAAASIGSSGETERIVEAIAVGLATCVGFAVVVALAGGSGGLSGRLRLLFIEPNQLARACAIGLVAFGAIFIHELFGQRSRSTLLMAGGFGLICAIALVLTQSRTGVAAAAVGITMVIGAQLSRRISIVAIGTVGLLLIAGAIAVLSGNAGESINQSLSRSTSQPSDELRTLNGRTVLWPEVLDVALERPATGVGLGLDRVVVSRFRAEGRVTWDAEHTHSLPLQLLLTMGVPGLLVGALSLGLVSAQAWGARDSLARTFALGALAVVLIDGIVEPTLRVPAFAWIVVAASSALLLSQQSTDVSEGGTARL